MGLDQCKIDIIKQIFRNIPTFWKEFLAKICYPQDDTGVNIQFQIKEKNYSLCKVTLKHHHPFGISPRIMCMNERDYIMLYPVYDYNFILSEFRNWYFIGLIYARPNKFHRIFPLKSIFVFGNSSNRFFLNSFSADSPRQWSNSSN